MAPSGEGHLYATIPWRDRLIIYQHAHPEIVQVIATEAWIRVDDGTDRIGDIGIYLVPNGPVPKIPDRVPDLMFEVVSPDKASRDRDYIRKRASTIAWASGNMSSSIGSRKKSPSSASDPEPTPSESSIRVIGMSRRSSPAW